MLRQYPGNNRYYNTSFKFLLKQAPLAVSRYKVEICKRKEGRKRGGETKEIKVKKKGRLPIILQQSQWQPTPFVAVLLEGESSDQLSPNKWMIHKSSPIPCAPPTNEKLRSTR